ncbi:RNA-binding protein [Bacillus spongiae]|uniref:RNA-binding protein n=1 Tax=Bacillus spongiae TaxID=2683610 RepID=A0ABU8HA12_9BACI
MNIYQHFREDERDFIDTVLAWKDDVDHQFAPKLTNFLDPREQFIVASIIGQNDDVAYSFFGGGEVVERKRCFLYPSYFKPDVEDYRISLFQIHYHQKFNTLDHRQVLGSLMSIGLGREKFGDILFDNGIIQFFADSDLKDYVMMNFESVGKATIKVDEIPLENALKATDIWKESMETVSSLRLDVVLSALLNMGRSKSRLLISSGKVKVNWREEESSSFLCEPGDIISIRGYGRIKVMAVEGKTKKDKWRMTVGLLK